MKHVVLASALLFAFSGTGLQEDAGPWQVLFNGQDLKGWDTYIGRPAAVPGQPRPGPIGLNTDPSRVFSVVQVDGAGAMRISGETFGGVSTIADFENYHFQTEFKWGTMKWAPRLAAKRDSGILYHANGPHGADGGNWMQSHEFQIQEGDCGDYWGVAGGEFDIPAQKRADNTYIYDPTAALINFRDRTPVGRHCVKSPDAEKPTGEWNTVDIYAFGDTAVHVINGTVNMVLTHSKHPVDGKFVPLTRGKIQLQSEGAEVFYRNVRLQTIKAFPKAIQTQIPASVR